MHLFRRSIKRIDRARTPQRKVDGAWKVRRRTIVLDANVLLDKNLSVFL